VNGGQRTGSLSPDFEDVDNSTLPIRLVYARPPSTPANNHHHHYDFTTRRERYHSVDGVSLQQVSSVKFELLQVGLRKAQPCRYCCYSVAPNGFSARRKEWRHIAPKKPWNLVGRTLRHAEFHIYLGKNMTIQPPNLYKNWFGTNLPLRGDSLAFLWYSQGF